MKIVLVALAVVFALSTVPALAIEYPVDQAEAQAFGEARKPNVVAAAYLKVNPDLFGPSYSMTTPFLYAAFVYSEAKATFKAVTPDELRAIGPLNTNMTITASAFSTILGGNDDMVVVLRQDGQIIQPIFSGRPNAMVTTVPKVGYATHRAFRFSMSSLDFARPFTIIIGNVVTDGALGKQAIESSVTTPQNIK